MNGEWWTYNKWLAVNIQKGLAYYSRPFYNQPKEAKTINAC
jgi:hypothetical protein